MAPRKRQTVKESLPADVESTGRKKVDRKSEDQTGRGTERSSLSLEAVDGPCKGSVYLAKTKRITVGRTRVNNFHFKDSTVSERHAVFEWNGEQWMLTDLGSSNGTTVQGASISEGVPVPVYDGDEITFGTITRTNVTIRAPLRPDVTVKEFLEHESERLVRRLERMKSLYESKAYEGVREELVKLKCSVLS